MVTESLIENLEAFVRKTEAGNTTCDETLFTYNEAQKIYDHLRAQSEQVFAIIAKLRKHIVD